MKKKHRQKAKAVVPQDNPVTSRIIHTGRTAANVYVDADTALRNDTVWACVQYLTKAVAHLPWRVMKVVGQGGDVQDKHPVDWLLHKRPCPDMGAFSWRQTMLGQALLRGNAYAEIEWDNRGMPYALWPIHPDRVRVSRDDAGALQYEVWSKGGNVVLPASDVFHVRGFGEGAVGYSVVEYAAQSIGWAQATELFGSTYFGEGMNPSGIITSKAGLSPAALELLRADMDRLYKGPKGKRTMILDADMGFQKLTSSPDESQFIESMQHQVEQICRWFGVPPHKVMHLLRATYSNIEHQSIEVVVDSVTPWVRVFEEEADYKLFGAMNRQGFYSKMNMRALLRGDNASRAQFYKALYEMGALSTNDILSLEDMNGIGPDGDKRFRSTNLVPLDYVDESPAAVDDPVADPVPPASRRNNGKAIN